MVKKAKASSKNNKKLIKTTLIVLVLFALAAGIFLFFHKDKEKLSPAQLAKAKAVQEELNRVSKGISVAPVTPVVKVKAKKKSVERIRSAKGAKIAFVLDDWGYRMNNCHYLKEIKAPLTIAILPNLRHSDDIMKCASLYDKDVMLHLPLEPYHTFDAYPDYYLITTKMPQAKIESLIDDSFKKMPLIVGVNNHMGSKATEDKTLMRIIFKKIKKKGLFFMDSMTSPHHSICGELADEMKLPFAKRDVFLDNVNTREAIEKQMVELADKARRQGYAIAIGHDRKLTMQVLQDDIPLLQKQGFEIVHVKDLLRNKD
jgi:polysaccharide deacetylase 2 family uncharacterized protein YibQ